MFLLIKSLADYSEMVSKQAGSSSGHGQNPGSPSSQRSFCCRWASTVPCSSLCACLLAVSASGACATSLFIAVTRLRKLIDQPDLIPFFLPLCVGTLIGMIVVAVVFIIISTVSLGPMSSKINSNGRNVFARIVNCFMIFLVVVLQLVWILISMVIAVFLTALLQIVSMERNRPNGRGCLRINEYGLPSTTKPICGPDFKLFTDKIQDYELILCAFIALMSAICIVISQTFFIIFMTMNYTRLKDARVYQNGSNHHQHPTLADCYQTNDYRPPQNYLAESRM